MPRTDFAGTTVEVSDEGYFIKAETWTEDMALEIAAREGVDRLTEKHRQVIGFMRERYLNREFPPTCRVMSKHCDVSTRQLYRMFPRHPVKIAAKIAGVPEPRSYLGGCGVNWESAWGHERSASPVR
jgi:tRNA 2-thiouridine synthesizing protein E